jgi:hypothetical protein
MLSFNQFLWWALHLLLVPYNGLSRALNALWTALGGVYGCFLAACGLAWCVGMGYGVFIALAT